ncbi:MAG: HNH endonuclease [Actinomycetaceae bacterium]
MAVLSDLLGIPHFTTSRGSTVRRDFLVEVGRALGVRDSALSGSRKDEVLGLAVEAATGRPMDATLLSAGATVTNQALQVIIDGVIEHGVRGRLDAQATPIEELAEERAEEFDPSGMADERTRQLARVARREGQDRFRTALLDAYGARCAISGYDAPAVLEAAHIYPHRGRWTNVVANGLLLRADLHRLFDRGAIAVDESSYAILVKPDLRVTDYEWLVDRSLRRPRRTDQSPSTRALREHREWAGL